jgi:hypothetical protein
METITKTCIKCNVEKDLSNFSPHKRYKHGVVNECKSCRVILKKEFDNKNRERYLENNRKNSTKFRTLNRDKYNLSTKMSIYKKLGVVITKEEYLKLYEQQEGKCKICNMVPTGHKKTLCLDHDHITLKVRGLLCDNCNTALGKFKDDVELLQKAINYLKTTYNG